MVKMTEELKGDEGFSDRLYMCTAGKMTIGYGYNLEDNEFPKSIAEQLLTHNIMTCAEKLSNYNWFNNLDNVRQRVIINMTFNLGLNGMFKFKKMIAAIKDKNFELASKEMLDSRWALQVGGRANRLSDTMREG